MLNLNQIKLGTIVSFELHPSMMIGTGYTRAKVEGLLNFDDANKYIDAMAVHIQVYPTLPAGVPNNPRQYWYVKLKLVSGETTVVGVPWIKEDTYAEVNAQAIRFTIPEIDQDDEQIIRMQLTALGYKMVDVEYIDSPPST